MEKKLRILGLTQNEAKVYIALNKYEHAMVHAIAREAGINRTTAYGVLHKLLHKGVVTEKRQNDIQYFSAIKIDVLFDRVSEEYQDLKEVMPQIKTLQNLYTIQPKIHFYHGLQGVKTLYEDTLTAKKEILGYVNPQYSVPEFYEYQYDEYIPKRIRKKIPFRGIYLKNDFSLKLRKKSKELLKEMRFLPKEKFAINHEINIYNDKIIYIFFKKKLIYGAMIQDEDLIKTERSIFEMLWEYALNFDQDA